MWKQRRQKLQAYYSGNLDTAVCVGIMPYTRKLSSKEELLKYVTKIAETNNEDKGGLKDIRAWCDSFA